jgi:cation diffusion facilitator CzcD-associated flavoprotein CzcO
VSQNPTANEPQDAAEEFDVVVVGGGVAGLYCSWKLSER